MQKVVKTVYSRNLWRVMEKFNVLPTDESFMALTDLQLGYIMGNMTQDIKEENLRRKGVNPDSYFEDEDDSWWNQRAEEFTPLKEEDNEEEIARQVEAMTSKDELEKVRARFKNTDEWTKYLEEGGKDARKMAAEEHIQKQLVELYKDAAKASEMGEENWRNAITEGEAEANAKLPEISKDNIQDAIDLFNGTGTDDLILPDMDDDFSI